MDVTSILSEQQSKFKATSVEKLLPLDFDLGNLLASDNNELNDGLLAKGADKQRDEYLLDLARDNVQLLLNEIFARPTTSTDMGVLASLPAPSTLIPREKPIPKEKAATRWEKFAKAKGIQKKKRSRMVIDEASGEYKPRWGYKAVTGDKESAWLMEVPHGADPMEDQYQKARDEKRERVDKNKRREKRNLEEAAAVAAGKDPRKAKEAKKDLLQRELAISKSSTASLGRFDKKLEGDKKIRGMKRKFESSSVDTTKERKSALDILDKVTGTKKSSATTINVRKAIRSSK